MSLLTQYLTCVSWNLVVSIPLVLCCMPLDLGCFHAWFFDGNESFFFVQQKYGYSRTKALGLKKNEFRWRYDMYSCHVSIIYTISFIFVDCILLKHYATRHQIHSNALCLRGVYDFNCFESRMWRFEFIFSFEKKLKKKMNWQRKAIAFWVFRMLHVQRDQRKLYTKSMYLCSAICTTAFIVVAQSNVDSIFP